MPAAAAARVSASTVRSWPPAPSTSSLGAQSGKKGQGMLLFSTWHPPLTAWGGGWVGGMGPARAGGHRTAVLFAREALRAPHAMRHSNGPVAVFGYLVGTPLRTCIPTAFHESPLSFPGYPSPSKEGLRP